MSVFWPYSHGSAVKKQHGSAHKKPPQIKPESPDFQLTPDEKHALIPASADDLFISPDTLEIKQRRHIEQKYNESRHQSQIRPQVKPQEPDIIDRPWRGKTTPKPDSFSGPKNPTNWRKVAAIMENLRLVDPAISEGQNSSIEKI